ncbi:hypothetical protein GLO73106DRAFT_00037150, partial [Gloeocapsa sp. PCC 73106]
MGKGFKTTLMSQKEDNNCQPDSHF